MDAVPLPASHVEMNLHAISQMSLQDKVWLGVLLRLISCKGHIGAGDWSVLWGRPDNGAGIYDAVGQFFWPRETPPPGPLP